MAGRTSTKRSSRGTTPRKPRTTTAAKAAPRFEAKVGDKKSLDAAVKAAAAWRAALEQRDAAIKKAVASGTSARQVAQNVGLTHAAVLKIVKR
jgi:DNA-binding NarL/FixJ family response regulator